jgi:hypothetical protein
MSSIKKIMMLGALFLSAFAVGCGSSSPTTATTNDHDAPGWLPAGHMQAALANQDSCTECHGSDFSGGISGVSCSQCHLGGVDSVHPADWGSNILTLHGAYVNLNGTGSCANAYCHGTQLQGVDQSGPACSTCH